MTKTKPFHWLFIAFIASIPACKKDSGKTNGPSVVLLTRITNTKTNQTINIIYDEQNRPKVLTQGLSPSGVSRSSWVSRYDSKNNIAEIRDTGYVDGGFSVSSRIKQKTSFEYDNQGRITRSNFYDLISPFFPDTTKPVSYAVNTYYNDSIGLQSFILDAITGTYKTGPDYTAVYYTDGAGNIVHFSDTGVTSGYPNLYSITGTYSSIYNNPLALLPPAFVAYSMSEYLAYPYAFLLAGTSKLILETANEESSYYSEDYNSMVTIENEHSNSFIASDLSPEYPATVTQSISRRFTNLTTGEVSTSNEVTTVKFEYIKK